MCEHKDGWYLITGIVINSELENDDMRGEFKCNTLGCNARKNFKFDITNVEEVKEK